jgi:hypothetical protein
MKLFTSCDSVYLRVHAPALVASAACNDNSIHVNVVSSSYDDVGILEDLSSKYHKIAGWPSSDFTWSLSTPFAKPTNAEETRTMFACDRFLSAAAIMESHKEDLLIIDTDCLIMNHIFDIHDDQIGLFLRDPLPGTQGWENAGSRVAAGVVFVSKDSVAFLEAVSQRIKQGPLAWFLDQVALNEVYQEHMGDYRFKYFDSQFMDWEFVEGTTIWTGKGPRKYENETYLAKKAYFDRMMR